MRKHSIHAALVLAIFGIAGTFGGLMTVFGALGGQSIDNPAAAYAQAFMAILCIFFIILGVKSFIKARKSPQQAMTSKETGNNPES